MADGVKTFLRPRTLDEALAALAADAAHPPVDPLDRLTPLAGATDFYPAATTRQAWFQPSPRAILDLSGLDELRGIGMTADGIRIGALATWSDMIAAPLPPAFDALRQAARQVGGVQIQNRGTLAGNLCNASPAADGAPPLLALDAAVELRCAAGAVACRSPPSCRATAARRSHRVRSSPPFTCRTLRRASAPPS